MWNFVADVGGTNMRLAAISNAGSIVDQQSYQSKGDLDFPAACAQFISEHATPPEAAVIAAAGVVADGAVRLTNSSQGFSEAELARACQTQNIKILNDFNQTIPAILLNKILFFLQDEEAGLEEGMMLVITAFVMMSIKTVAENLFFYEVIRISIQIKVAVIGLVFRKSLRLTPGARAYHSEGQIMNLMQQDSERLMWFIPLSPMLISGTLQIFLNSMLLFYYIGVTSVVGIIMLGGALTGFMRRSMGMPSRLLLGVAAILMVAPNVSANLWALALAAPVLLPQFLKAPVGAAHGRDGINRQP